MIAPARPEDVRVEKHLPLVHALLKRGPYARIAARVGLDYQDLVQAGAIGLIRARERWKPELSSWGHYAGLWILAEVRRYLSLHGSTVRVPAHQQDRRRAAGEAPYAKVVSLDCPIGHHYGDIVSDDAGSWHDVIAAPNDDLDLPSLEDLIASTPRLTEREVQVLRWRAQGVTLEEIAGEMGVSRERARQIEEHAVSKIRTALGITVEPAPAKPRRPRKPKVRRAEQLRVIDLSDPRLDDTEREIIRLRRGGHTLRAIARRHGCSRQWISQRCAAALARLRQGQAA